MFSLFSAKSLQEHTIEMLLKGPVLCRTGKEQFK